MEDLHVPDDRDADGLVGVGCVGGSARARRPAGVAADGSVGDHELTEGEQVVGARGQGIEPAGGGRSGGIGQRADRLAGGDIEPIGDLFFRGAWGGHHRGAGLRGRRGLYLVMAGHDAGEVIDAVLGDGRASDHQRLGGGGLGRDDLAVVEVEQVDLPAIQAGFRGLHHAVAVDVLEGLPLDGAQL